MNVLLGMEETTEMLRPPLVVTFLRSLYEVANELCESTRRKSHKWPVVEVQIAFTSPPECDVDSMEIVIYETQIETIAIYLELVMKDYSDFCVLTVKSL